MKMEIGKGIRERGVLRMYVPRIGIWLVMPTDILRMVAVAISTRKKMLLLFQSYEK
jgi:hypothetical protein